MLKRARLSHEHLERLALGSQPVARVVAESFPFQRPTSIAENFRLLDRKLDLAGAMRKPYRRRKTSLFESIERLIEVRNEFVHSGRMNLKFFDTQLRSALLTWKWRSIARTDASRPTIALFRVMTIR